MRIILLLVGTFMVNTALACDICGCAPGGMGFGYIPLQNTHLIGLTYENSRFSTVHPGLFTNDQDQTGTDHFQSASLWLRYHFNKRFLGMAIVPFKMNSATLGDQTIRLSGLGDVQAKAMYGLIQKGSSMDVKQLNWFLGGSVILPTGQVDDKHLESLPNLQPGRGVIGGEVNTMLSYRRYNLGFNAETALGFSHPNSSDYRYGNEVRSSLMLFSRLKRERFSYLPQLGISYVYRAQDIKDVSQNTVNTLSGIDLFSAVAGFAVYGTKIGFRGFCSVPVSYHITSGLATPKPQINLQFLHTITFKKSKK